MSQETKSFVVAGGTDKLELPSDYPHADITTLQLSAYNNNLVGKILTVIDATGIDDRAKKAVKDLIKQTFYDQFDTVKDWMQDQNEDKGSSFPYVFAYDLKPGS